MTAAAGAPRIKAALVAGAIFALGIVTGVAADRSLGARTAPRPAVPAVTMADMARALRLDPGQQARVDAVLDSVRPELARAAALGPDSLRLATRRARDRISQALPPGRRAAFQQWLDTRHARMMEMMRRMGPGMMGPGMMGPGTMGPGMTGPRGMPAGTAGAGMTRPRMMPPGGTDGPS